MYTTCPKMIEYVKAYKLIDRTSSSLSLMIFITLQKGGPSQEALPRPPATLNPMPSTPRFVSPSQTYCHHAVICHS